MNKLSVLLVALAALSFASCRPTPTIDDVFLCDEFWDSVDLSAFCGMDIGTDFILIGDVGTCNASSGDAFPGDELVFITVGNHGSVKDAKEEFERIKVEDSSADNFVEVSGVGDDAYAFIYMPESGGLETVLIETRKGQYTVTVEVRFIGEDHCLSHDTAYDFIREVISTL